MQILTKSAVYGLVAGLLMASTAGGQATTPFKSRKQRDSSTLPSQTQATTPQVPQGPPAQTAPPAVPGTQRMNPAANPTAVNPPATSVQTQNLSATNTPFAPKFPSSPPRVSFQNGELTVVAENSSLGETLNAIRAATGIKIEGSGGGSDRVMAKIGPAPVRDVLLSLLEGSRYDFAMLGSETDPQKIERLVLTPRVASNAPTSAPAQSTQDDAANATATADDDDNEGFAEPAKPAPGVPAAGAPPGGAATPPGQVKTPEQLLEDLRKLEADKAAQQQAQPSQPADPNAPRPARPERPK